MAALAAFVAISAAIALARAAAPSATKAPLIEAVDAIGITVGDLDRSIAFYRDVLSFSASHEEESSGAALEQLTGVFGAHVRSARLTLGDQAIVLTQFLTPRGRPVPPDGHSNDRTFQHVAIVVADMDRAYRRLREHRVRFVSTEPQTLPAWNKGAAGIKAFYFADPDDHTLEVIWFPPGKGDPRCSAARAAPPAQPPRRREAFPARASRRHSYSWASTTPRSPSATPSAACVSTATPLACASRARARTTAPSRST